MAAVGIDKVVSKNLTGVVHKFDQEKHYGFIRFGERTIFTHHSYISESNIESNGRRYLLKNQSVTFDLHEGPKGLNARNVRVIEPASPTPLPPAKVVPVPKVRIVQKNVPGHIIRVKAVKKYCIISTNCSEFETLLGHFNNFKHVPEALPAEGMSVLCDVVQDNTGKHVAQNIRVPPPNPRGAPPDSSTAKGLRVIKERVDGTVVDIKKDRGFAIIETKDLGTLLCHYTHIKTSDGSCANLNVQLGQRVVCDVAENLIKKSKIAIKVVPGEVPKQDELKALNLEDGAKKDIAAIQEELMCYICLSVLENPVTLPCQHLFCWECIFRWLEFQDSCPVDRKKMTVRDLKVAPPYVRNMLEKVGR